jgi:hypothetical protein
MSPTICIQCNLRAFVEGRSPVVHEETIAEHMERHHPSLVQARKERAELARRAQEIYERTVDNAG